jgi:hypothetical protein
MTKTYSRVLELHEEEGTTNTAKLAFTWPNRRIYYDRNGNEYIRSMGRKYPLKHEGRRHVYHGLDMPGGHFYFVATYRVVPAIKAHDFLKNLLGTPA